jgi:RNA polymerase sigma factor (sigma-70 family)
MTWHELIARAAAGDVDAQDQVVRDFEPRVRRLVHRHLSEDFRRSHHWMLAIFSTRDVVQDILIATVRALETADFPSEEALAAYLATMVRHRLLDAVKHHEAARRDARRDVRDDASIEQRSDPSVAGATPSSTAELAEQARIVGEVLDSFDARPRALLVGRLIEERPFAELAAELGYASAESARGAWVEAHARLLVRLRMRGVRPPGETLID